MFTTPAFIRKNTPDLRRKLEELGYTHHLPHTAEDDNKRDFILCFDGNYYLLNKNNWVIRRGHPLKKYGSIDCVTNEQLFLALSALRDDSGYMQWFWYKGCLFLCRGTGSTICMDGSYSLRLIIGNGFFETMNNECRKATVEELIEHFKTKEQ